MRCQLGCSEKDFLCLTVSFFYAQQLRRQAPAILDGALRLHKLTLRPDGAWSSF